MKKNKANNCYGITLPVLYFNWFFWQINVVRLGIVHTTSAPFLRFESDFKIIYLFILF